VADGLEIEVKLRVGDPARGQDRLAATKARLEEMGAALVHPREFENNLAFDFPDRSIVRMGSLLRVRILARGTLLTFKGPVEPAVVAALAGGAASAPGSASTPGAAPGSEPRSAPSFKARRETEIDIPFDETDALLAILRGLGMAPVFQYQKYRTSWNWKGLHILLDETPIGIYLELEGDRALIEAGAKALGYRPDDFIIKSYRDLYLEHLDRGDQGLEGSRSADRMVFD
jgi:adenylate cyclase class 2